MTYLTKQAIREAAAAVERNPSQAQTEAGNYRKGHFAWNGLHIVIENPRGSARRGVAANGKAWESVMPHHYGYVRSSEGADGDPVDVFMGPHPECNTVWVIDQVDPNTGRFDEHKVMLGFRSEAEAGQAYLDAYEPGWQGLGGISAVSVEGFKAWLENGEALSAMALPPDAPIDLDPETLVGTFRGKVIQFRCIGWDEDECRPLLKAEGGPQAIPPGAHWITVHPNGPGTVGHPVLVVPVEGHKGVHRIIGGAGGRLNGLRLHGVKDKGTYEAESKARREESRAKERERQAGMSPQERAQEKAQAAQAKTARKDAEEEFVRRVLGQTGEAQALFEEGENPETPSLTHKEKLAKAKAVVKAAERRILLDAESRVKAGLGQIGGQAAPLDLEDILQESSSAGPGYRRALAERAAQMGLTAEKLAEKVAEIKGRPAGEPKEDTGRPTPVPTSDEAQENREMQQGVQVLEAGRTAAMRDAVKKAMEQHGDLAQLLKARSVMREAVAATKRDKGRTFEPGYQMVTEADATPDEKAIDDLHQQLLTRNVVALLNEVGDTYPIDEVPDPYGVPPAGGVQTARGVGAFDALHETSLAAIGQGVIERDVVEALGPEHSAMIVARAMRHEFTHEDQEQILQALEAHHLTEQERLPQTVEEAQRLKATAEQMGADIAATPRDFALAVEMGKQKVAVLKEAGQMLGAALGRLEARAALIAALRQPPQDELTIPLGHMTAEKAVQTAAALGLQDGDYQINHDSGEAVLHLNEQGQDRLIHPVDQAALAERQIALSLKSGQLDEDNWRPKGFADRSGKRHDNPLVEPMEFRRELQIEAGQGDHQQAVGDYIGALMADGHDPADILADLHSGARKSAMDPETRQAYEQTLQRMCPLRVAETDEQGNPVPERDKATGEILRDTAGQPLLRTRPRKASEIRADFEKHLSSYLQTAGDANHTLNGQTVEPDRDFHESMHRALAEDPRAAAAFRPVGELGHEEQGHLRDYFYKAYFSGSKNPEEAKKARLHAELDAIGPEPPRENPDTLGTQMSLMDLLGEEDAGDAAGAAVNPAWVDWNNKRLEVQQKHAEKADGPSPLAEYVKRLGGLKYAQQAIQDEIKGQFAERFHEHYKRTTGRALHLDTQEQHLADLHMKAALGGAEAEELERARRSKQAKIQNRGGRGFQEGSVTEHMQQGAQTAAMAQAEGSLFGMDELEEAPAPEAKQPWQKPERVQGERYTLGRSLEAQIAQHMGAHAPAFQGQRNAVKIRDGMHMSGDFVQQQRCVKGILNLKRIGLFQGAGCVYGGTMLRCEKRGVTRSFYEWWLTGEAPSVKCVAADGTATIADASPIFVKGHESMLKIEMSNGASMVVTPAHRFLGPDGWVFAGDITAGTRLFDCGDPSETKFDLLLDLISEKIRLDFEAAQGTPDASPRAPRQSTRRGGGHQILPNAQATVHGLFAADHQSILQGEHHANLPGFGHGLLASILGRALQAQNEGGPHFGRKPQDSQGHCSGDSRPCGEQLRLGAGAAQGFAPSPADARARNPQSSQKGDPGHGLAHNRACPGFGRLAMPRSEDQGRRLVGDAQSRATASPVGSSRQTHQGGPQSGQCSILRRGKAAGDLPTLLPTGASAFPCATVLSVQPAGDHIVFDLSVPATSNYFCHSLINHNSGKTAIMQGALAQLHAEKKLKGKAILAVPSVVQGQFGAEAAQFLDPTSGFKLHAQPGESWEERLRAYQDPETHAVVVTHQTLRDDTLRMIAAHLDTSPAEASERLMSLPKKDAAKLVKDAMWAHGVNVHALMCDEAHSALDRDGKPDSVFSRVLDTHSHNAEYVVQATGDPMKNDISEVWSDLNKIDPHRWHDGTKDEFMRRYGANAELAKRSMAQELTRYWFNGRVKVPVEAHRRNESIPLTDGQKTRIQAIETAAGKLQTGQGDLMEHAKALAPEAFKGKPEDQHQAIAETVRKAVGTYREHAMNRAINLDPEGGKLAHHVQVAKDRIAEGKPVVLFARNLEAVAHIHAAMEKAGLKSVSLTGADSSKDKAEKAGRFTRGEADVIVMSDAGAVGLNLQRGKVIIHHDLPNTAMIHNQRTARIHRLGQTENVEVITAMADHPWERNNLDRVRRKDTLGAIFQSPEGYLDDSGLANTLREVRSRKAQATGAVA